MKTDKATTTLRVGFDDTDSPVGMCTTYLAYLIAGKFCKVSSDIKKSSTISHDNTDTHVEFLDYPKLIRFNPNVPWKTRGNGAVALHIKTNNPTHVKNVIKNMVFSHADIAHGANPGLVFFEYEKIHDDIVKFGKQALWQLISRTDAKRFAKKHRLEHYYKGNGQGLIGAIGAIGYAWDDYTLELLSYRTLKMCGTPRVIDAKSVKRMQKHTAPHTFNSYDEKRDRILITPRGPDPVFYGIRGEDTRSLITASRMVQSRETPQGYMIFRTNQGTDAHMQNELTPNYIKPYASGWIIGTISDVGPYPTRRGGHVFFDVSATSASGDTTMHCAVYKPTKLTHIASHLIKGDKVRIGGGIRKASKNHNQRVLNVEYIDVISLAQDTYLTNPTCHICKKNMKSKGVGQGFECVKCKERPRADSKIIEQKPRIIKQGLYIPDIGAQRHLTRPRQRYNTYNQDMTFENNAEWLQVYNSNNSGE